LRSWVMGHPDVIAVVGMAVLCVALMGDYWFGGSDMVPGLPTEDGRTQWLPWRVFAARHLRHGVIPLWNPHVLCGVPFLADFQSALFYPPNVLYVLLPIHWAVNVSTALHLFLSLAFTYALARRFGVSRPGGAVAGLAFALGGQQFLRMYQGNWGAVCAIPWIPALFLCADVVLSRGGARWAALGGLALALQLLSGAPQFVLYTLGALAVYCVCCMVLTRGPDIPVTNLSAGGNACPARAWPWGLVCLPGRTLGLLGLAVCIGFALAAIQVVPGLAVLGELVRSRPLNPKWVESFYLPLENLATLMVPRFFGDDLALRYWGRWNFWETCVYLGALALPLAAASPFYPQITQISLSSQGLSSASSAKSTNHSVSHARASVGSLWAVAIVCLVLALGRQTPVYRMLGLVLPGVVKLRGAAKMACLASFALAMLAGFGCDAIFMAARRVRARKVALRAACGLGVLVALFGAWTWLFPGGWERLVNASLNLGGRYRLSAAGAEAARRVGGTLAGDDAWRSAALLAAGALLIWVSRRDRSPARVNLPPHTAAWLVAGVMLVDLATFGRRYLGPECRFDPYLRDSPLAAEDLKGEWERGDRFFVYDWPAMNDAMILGFHTVEGIEPNPPLRFHELFRRSQKAPTDIAPSLYQVFVFSKTFRLMGLRWVVIPRGVRAVVPDMPVRVSGRTCQVFENEEAVPRAYLAAIHEVVPGRSETLRRVRELQGGPVVILEQAPDGPPLRGAEPRDAPAERVEIARGAGRARPGVVPGGIG